MSANTGERMGGASKKSRNQKSGRNAFLRVEEEHRQTAAVLFQCRAHGNAGVMCVTAGKVGRQRHQAALGATIFWCTCPSLNNALAHLEQSRAVQTINHFLSLYPSVAAGHCASHSLFETHVEKLLREKADDAGWRGSTTTAAAASASQGESGKEEEEQNISEREKQDVDPMVKEGVRRSILSSSLPPSPSLQVEGRGKEKSIREEGSPPSPTSFSSSSLWDFYHSHFISPPDPSRRKYGNAALSHPTIVKCLHALVAQELCGAVNPIGEAICNYLCFLHQLFQMSPLQNQVDEVEGGSEDEKEEKKKKEEKTKQQKQQHGSTRFDAQDTSVGVKKESQWGSSHWESDEMKMEVAEEEEEKKEDEKTKVSAGVRPYPRRWQAVLMEDQHVLEAFLRASLLPGDRKSSSSSSSASSCVKEKADRNEGGGCTSSLCPPSGACIDVILPCVVGLTMASPSTTITAPVASASSGSLPTPPPCSSSSSCVIQYRWNTWADLKRGIHHHPLATTPSISSSSSSGPAANEEEEDMERVVARGEQGEGSRVSSSSSASTTTTATKTATLDLCEVAHEVIAAVNGKARIAKKRRIN